MNETDFDVAAAKDKIFQEAAESRVRAEKSRMVILPGTGRLASDFADEVGSILRDKNDLFFRPQSKDIVEVGSIKDKDKKEEYTGFVALRPDRFVTKIEQYFRPGIMIETKWGTQFVPKSISVGAATVCLNSSNLQEALHKIKRIFPVPLPIMHEGKLTFPEKGYDQRFESWLDPNAPEIKTDMPLEEAREIIRTIFKEFCFKDKSDYINAIAAILTPFCRGLFKSFNTRTPIDIYVGNRERAGKDCCAGCTGVLYEGHSLEEPPISNGDGNSGSNDELRKKLLAALIAGRKRLHFANNKGHIDNSVLEGFVTAEKYSDRPLGRNEILTFDNEIDISMSGNVGITYTPDLANRSKFIRLFLDVEDANSRQFENPNLHQWVKDNRSLILSALYAFVRTWVELGCKPGTIPFTSFPEWARVVGGVMEAAGYDNPCIPDKEMLAMGGDSETKDMKVLFELCYERYPNQWIKKSDIKNIVLNDDSIFGYLDFNKKADQTKFGQKIIKFTGRVLSDIVLNVKDTSVRASRQEYMFTKEKNITDKGKIFGQPRQPEQPKPCHIEKLENNNIVGDKLPKLPELPNSRDLSYQEMLAAGYSQSEIDDFLMEAFK